MPSTLAECKGSEEKRTLQSTLLSRLVGNQTGAHFHVMLLAEEEEEDELGEPLILRIDQDDQGSVGSEDTSRFDSDDDLPLPETGQQLCSVHSDLAQILLPEAQQFRSNSAALA